MYAYLYVYPCVNKVKEWYFIHVNCLIEWQVSFPASLCCAVIKQIVKITLLHYCSTYIKCSMLSWEKKEKKQFCKSFQASEFTTEWHSPLSATSLAPLLRWQFSSGCSQQKKKCSTIPCVCLTDGPVQPQNNEKRSKLKAGNQGHR